MIDSRKRRPALTLALTGMFTALTFVFTMISIPMPGSLFGGGLMHLGTVPMMFACLMLGWKEGAFAGAVGMGLFDLLSPYAVWAPFTFVIRGVMGLIVGKVSGRKNRKNVGRDAFAILLGGAWMIAGYYFAQCILFGNWIAAFRDMLGDAAQVASALVLTLPLVSIFRRSAGQP